MKLEDIKKENVYSVPDRYFEQLPNRVQSRLNKKESVFAYFAQIKLVYRLAIPVIALVLLIVYIGGPGDIEKVSAEQILAEVSSEDVIAYLQTTDITTEEIIKSLDLEQIPADFDLQEPLSEDLEMSNDEINKLMDTYGIDENLL